VTRELYGIATPFSISKIDRDDLICNFDVLHIHNWYNLLSMQDLKYLGERIPLVFSMHDERLLTGGCHMSIGCNRFKDGCHECPAVLIGKSTISHAKDSISQFLFHFPKFEIVAPSRWIKKQFDLAYPNLGSVCTTIPNIIDLPETKPREFRSNSILDIVFISANLFTPVKGLKCLIDAITEYDLTSKIRLHLVGKGVVNSLPKNLDVMIHGQLTPREVSTVMQNCDLLVIPRLSENSPNVIAEAQLQGLPILASDVGGIPELIEHAVTGFLANPDVDSLGLELRHLLSKPKFAEISINASDFARNYWNNDRNISSHLDVYRRVTR
jgi:glycosyltransferase involved in cell wall biosynthesis